MNIENHVSNESGSGERVSSTASHNTPGPWAIFWPHPAYKGHFAAGDSAGIYEPATTRSVASCATHTDNWRENARLIAAAPTMLEALRQVLVLSYTDSSTDPAIVSTCKTAIAKATGEP